MYCTVTKFVMLTHRCQSIDIPGWFHRCL